MMDDRPPLRDWTLTALIHGTKMDSVELRVERRVYQKTGDGPRRKLLRLPGFEEAPTLSLDAWMELRGVLVAAGAKVEERPRTAQDVEREYGA